MIKEMSLEEMIKLAKDDTVVCYANQHNRKDLSDDTVMYDIGYVMIVGIEINLETGKPEFTFEIDKEEMENGYNDFYLTEEEAKEEIKSIAKSYYEEGEDFWGFNKTEEEIQKEIKEYNKMLEEL